MNWLTLEQKNSLKDISLYKDLDNIQIQNGWLNVIREMGIDITQFCFDNKLELPIINQVKTKFGTLRFYYTINYKNQDLIDLINEWSERVNNTCEVCGSNNKVINVINSQNIVISLCVNHRVESDKHFNTFINFTNLFPFHK